MGMLVENTGISVVCFWLGQAGMTVETWLMMKALLYIQSSMRHLGVQQTKHHLSGS